MKTILIIPARYKSTRYPGKPLAQIKDRPAIQWTYEAACAVHGVDAVYVATDDDRIKDVVGAFGGNVIMTSEACQNGTERVAEAAETLGASDEDILINFQGDAPLTPPWFVEALIEEMKRNTYADMVTPVLRSDADHYARLIEDRKHGRVGGTTVVFDQEKRALYFSKEVIPYIPKTATINEFPVYHHVGVYAYRLPALRAYRALSIGVLERSEQLEQLRFLEGGRQVYVVEVDARGRKFWELNNPEDVAIIEAMMDSQKVHNL